MFKNNNCNSGIAIGCARRAVHIAVGAQTDPVRGRGRGALLESLHTGPLQPLLRH